NPLMGKYPLTFIGHDDDKCSRPNVAKEVRAFLVARMAVESFYWTPPDTGVQGLYVCRSWSMQKTGAVYQLTGTFEQVPR
ncbi:phage tail protein, partial [Priestia megaterium]|uniref:phage tail protein n=1 Tax=Priestia megaterium TaxID=1404 RepID=UPI00101DF365